jgi:hypothetical protein
MTSILSLFRFLRVLIIIGTVAALACLFVPFKTALGADRISAAGGLSGAVAAIFGLAVATLALFAYINREDVRRVEADRAWLAKQQLEHALHQFAEYLQLAYLMTDGRISDEFDRLLKPAHVNLLEGLAEARNSAVYVALSNHVGPNETRASVLLLALEAQVRLSLSENRRTLDSFVLEKLHDLLTSLQQITQENIDGLLRKGLAPEPYEFLSRVRRAGS